MSPLTDDERAKIGAVIDRMKADGASHEDIVAFLPQAQHRLQTNRLQARHAQNLAGIRKAGGTVPAADASGHIAYGEEDAPGTALGEYAQAAGEATVDKAKAIGRGAAAVATHPIATFTDDARRREFVRGVDDAVTFGYGKKLAARIDEALPAKLRFDLPAEERARAGWDELSPRPSGLRATEEADAQAAPDVRTGGNIAGAFVPGAGNLVGRGAAGVARRLVPVAKATGAAANAVRAGLTYEIAAPTIAAAHADSEGDRLGAALRVLKDPSGAALAAGAGVGAGRVNASRGAEARRYIEERGGRVGVTTPGKSGAFAAELAEVPANDKGIGQAARIGAEKVLEGVKEKHAAETTRPYQQLKAQIDASPEAARLRDVTPIVQNMQEAIYDLETAPMARSALREQLSLLERFRADPADPASPIMVPERQLNGLRRTLMRAAKVGGSDVAGEKEAPLRSAAFAAKEMVDQGPYAPLNKLYAEGAEKLKTTRRQLGLKPKPSADSNVDTKKVKLSLEREGQNTKTAGGDARLDAFRAANPELARQADLAELARARADLSFRILPQHGGLIERTAGATLGPGAAIGAGALAGGPAGVAAGLGILGLQNASPIAGRLLYPLTRSAEQASTNPVLAARHAERERARRRAETFAERRGRP